MTHVYTLVVDQNSVAIMLIGIFMLLGLGATWYGIYAQRRGFPIPPQRFQKDLMTWHILRPDTSPQAVNDIKRCQDYLLSLSVIGGGVAVLLMALGWLITVLVTPDASASMINNGSTLMASVFVSLGIGLGCGAVFAAWRLRNAARRSVVYADLRQRRLSDYRSNTFRWLMAVMVVWTFAVLVFFAPHVGPTIPIGLLSIVVEVPNTLWGMCIVPGVMLLVFVLIELVFFRIVGFSRLLITSDTTLSQRADDMLRAVVIGTVQYCELLALGQLAALPYYMLSQRLWDSHYWKIGSLPYEGLLTVSLFMPAIMQLLGIGLLLARGRLGGKLSGWPWQTAASRQMEVRV